MPSFPARHHAQALPPYSLTRLAAALLAAGLFASTAQAQAQAQVQAQAQAQSEMPAEATLSPGCACTAPVNLQLERSLGANRGVTAGDAQLPLYARADRVRGLFEERTELSGNVEVRRGGLVLRGDRVLYAPANDELEVEGNARLAGEGAVFSGPRLKFFVDQQTGSMPDVNYSYVPRQARGNAKLLEFLGDGKARLNNATYTTCAPGDQAWWVQADQLDLDRNEQQGVARNSTLYFQGVPVFASPYFQFPLNNDRRSGLLTPSLGFNTKLGTEVTLPWYWNIAPNRDYTITPRLMSRRGVLLQNEFRYLEPTHRGTFNFDYMPNDADTGGSREFISLRPEFAHPSGVGAGLNYNRVTDDRFFADFSRNIIGSSETVLPQEGYLNYNAALWNAAVRVTKNQTLESLLRPGERKPYERVPQLLLNAKKLDWAGFDAELTMDGTQFSHPRLEEGQRFIFNPSLSYPLLAPGWFVIPRVQWHYTAYSLDRRVRGNEHSPVRSLPISSVDSGLVFERDARWLGRDVQQTLEPRLFYTYIPYRDQSQLPVFDTALADFNFTQLFTENQFVGGDRIGEANQVTAALVSRLLDTDSGTERLRATIGQRYYFSSQRVTLAPSGGVREDSKSDILAALSGRVTQTITLGGAIQYGRVTRDVVVNNNTVSVTEDSVLRSSVGLRWQPRPSSVLSFAYRYKINDIEQYDVAAQWPLAFMGLSRWYGVGRANYSKRERRWVETLAGLEYKADCWVGRLAVQRFTTPDRTTTTAGFFQIELNGLASVGTSPVEQLRRNIPGYQLINPPPREPGRFEYYE